MKAHPMLVDKTALAIIQAVDVDFARIAKNVSEMSQIAWITGCIIIDEAIRVFLAKYPQGTIVNIGCGLDTTFERVDYGRLTWYDLDLPDVITLRLKFIQETWRRRFIAASFLNIFGPAATRQFSMSATWVNSRSRARPRKRIWNVL